MRLNKAYLLTMLFFFVGTPLSGGVAAAEDDPTKNVLILNSYHPGYAWSDEEQAGIVDTFRARNPNWLPYIEYLDCKRFPIAEHLRELGAIMDNKYRDVKFSLVIAMDDPALEFVLNNRTKLFENIPIVFCGINNFTPAMLVGHSNVTGIAENIDIGGTIEAMLGLHPDCREILVLHDYTVTGLAVRKEVENLVPRFSARTKFRFIDRLDMKDVLKELDRLPKGSLVLEIGFITDKSGCTFGLTETTDLFVKHSPVPVYGAYEARLGHGIVGGKLTSAKIHGANAAMMAHRVLDGEKASNIPVATKSDAQFMFDHRAMERFGIPLSALPENSIIINQPVSFYAAHRTVIHFALAVIGVLCAIIGLLTINIVQRRRATIALSQSESRQRAILDNIPDPAWLKDKDGRYLAVNEAWCRLFNLNTSQVIGKTASDVLPAEVAKRFMEEDEEVIRHGSQLRKEESLMDNNGGISWFDKVKAPVVNGQGIVVGSTGITRDITERKQAEETLRESEEKFSKFFFSSPTWVAITRLEDGTYLEVNKTFEEITGFERKEVIGRTSLELGLWPEPIGDRQRFMAMAREEGGFRGQEVTFLAKNGEPITALWSADVIELAGQECLLGTVMDISELKRAREEKEKLQAQLHRAQKMEAMGLLAGGVAHDLNNILSGIVSYPELLLMDLPEDSPLRRPIKVMQESGMRAADVVEDLLTIARGVATGKEALNLNTIVTEYLKSPEYQTLEKTHSFVNLKTEIDPDILNMSGSPIHIKKTLMNLVTNASEAIEGAGTVTISTMNRYLDQPLKGYEGVRTGEYAVLSVSDDGSGITPKDLERIFEPFYTKKVMGRSGTGLGLAVVWNTVQDHKGYIDIKSSEKGTLFELYFPVTREEIAAEKEEVPLEDYLGHGEKILVVDDEERQIEIASGMLTKLGYNPEAVSSGEEAIEYMKENAVDLIVLDMVMPKGINGRETYEEIIKIRPGQKAIIASGYAKTKEVDIAQRLGAGKYIKKPYILEKIGLAIKEELEK